jgi:RHS repeat-associated protein
VVNYTYDPWGKPTITGDEELAALNPCSYRGYDYDEETGYFYLQSRYYDPNLGRFFNLDEIDYLSAAYTILGYNLFAYCLNNPISTKDSTGHFGTPIQWVFATVGAIVGVSLGGWLARQLGYSSSDWEYWAIRAGAIVGGAVLGWFSASLLTKLLKNYLKANPEIYIKIVSRYGYKTLTKIRSIFGLSRVYSNKVLAQMIYNKYVQHIFSRDHIKKGIMKLGSSKWNIFYKGFKIVLNKLWQAQEGPNEIHTYINGYKVTIRFYVENGWILSMDMFMGWATRVIGKLLK